MASGVPGENGPSVLAPVAVELRPGRESVKPRSSVLVLTLIRRSVTLIHVLVAQTKVNNKSYLDQVVTIVSSGNTREGGRGSVRVRSSEFQIFYVEKLILARLSASLKLLDKKGRTEDV